MRIIPGPIMLGRTTLSATRLHERLVELNGEPLQKSTLLPVFDVSGRIVFVVLLDTSNEVRVFCPENVRIRIGARGTIRIEAASGAGTFGSDHAYRAANLWHCDPWWLLKLERHQQFSHAAAVKASNCAKLKNPALTELFYRRDLTWVLKGAKTVHGSPKIVRFKSLRLPPREPSER